MFNITPVATRVNSGSNCAGMLVKMGPYNLDYCLKRLYPHCYFPWEFCSPTHANLIAAVINMIFSLFPADRHIKKRESLNMKL